MNKTLFITNPRTGKNDFELNCMSDIQVQEMAASLRQKQKSWWQIGLSLRIESLKSFASLLEENKQLLINALVTDTGRLNESVLEVEVVVSSIRRWCHQAPELLNQANERQAEIPFLAVKQSYMPYEVVAIISPWNFPLLLSLVDAIPALLAGCSVLLKPSEVTSRFVNVLNQILGQVPSLSDVLTIATGAGSTGKAVIENADLVSFTGSVKTGKKVGEACAKRFIPAFLELGGKDAAIVCQDADIELAAKALCWGSMVNAGQSCMSIERVYVHQSIADDFIKALKEEVQKLSHNYPDISKGDIGPIISNAQLDVINSQLLDAKIKGAKFETGGEVLNLGGGSYCQPTVITNVSDDMLVMSQESFAAILAVDIVESDLEAIEKANDSLYGLSAAVFSQNIEYADEIAEQLEAGAISINDASLTALVHEAEKQSFKYSGLGGSRMGKGSITRFMRKKAFIRNTGVASPWWFG